MGVEAGGRVKFDFTGALVLARKLWALADDLSADKTKRTSAVETAQAKFEGPHAKDFAGRMSTESLSTTNVVIGLREDAAAWAKAWAAAMDQQNKNNRAAKVKELSDNRNLFQKGVDLFNGDDSDGKVPHADPVPIPQPPSYLATATETTY